MHLLKMMSLFFFQIQMFGAVTPKKAIVTIQEKSINGARPHPSYSPVVAAHVTAYSRLYLLETLLKLHPPNVLYCGE